VFKELLIPAHLSQLVENKMMYAFQFLPRKLIYAEEHEKLDTAKKYK